MSTADTAVAGRVPEAASPPPVCPRSFDCSPTLARLATALAAAQGEFPTVEKNKRANIKSDSGSFAFDYADLATVLRAIRPVMSKHGLSIVQLPSRDARGGVVMTTVLLHSSGEYITGTLDWPVGKADARGIGSAITYARRYGATSITGVAADDEDDDGAAASEQPPTQSRGRERPRQRQTRREDEPARTTAEGDRRKITTTNADGSKGGQLGRLRKLMDEHAVNVTVLGGYLRETHGFEKLSDITRDVYDDVVRLVQQGAFSVASEAEAGGR